MRHELICQRPRRRKQSESGAVAILVSVSMVALIVAVAMVLDFGMVRLDRQMNKVSADTAATAGVRGLDRGDGKPHPFAGVCQALSYLKSSQADLVGLPLASAAPGNVSCPAGGQLTTVCNPSSSATWATYEATVGNLRVQIESPFDVADYNFPEENLDSLQGDVGDPALGGCDQLGVVVTETRKPALGSLATTSDLVSRIRSVGRITLGDTGEGAVGLLLLERNDCAVIDADGGGSGVLMRGFDGVPGMIHSDSLGNGSNCGPGSNVFNGNSFEGIVARESETGTPVIPGIIGSRALSGEPGAVPAKATDPIPEVYTGPYPPGGGPTARGLITREPVDTRYLAAVRAARDEANTRFTLTALTAPAAGYLVTGCDPDPTARDHTGPLYVDCPDNPGFNTIDVTLLASEVIFNGKVVTTNLSMPNATRVYVHGHNGVGINGDTFRMHHQGRATCGDVITAARAQLVVLSGAVESNGGLLQLCNTTVIMMGGDTTACLPATNGLAPTVTPCTGGTAGDGVIKIAGTAAQDWTAPNAVVEGADATYWGQLEDLALWTETYGTGPDFQMSGTGNMHLSGVFMAPNARPFNIKGGGLQQVENSQYVVRRLRVTGGGKLTMRPDPHDVITIPIIGGFSLVR